MIVRDVIGGMEELANLEGYQVQMDYLEILSIEPNDPVVDNLPEESPAPRHDAVVLPFPDLKKTA